ncbi:hypothetical protein D3C73_955900 [compost metagenome]
MVEGKRHNRGYADLRDGLNVDPAGSGDADTDQQDQQDREDADIQKTSDNQADRSAQYHSEEAVNTFFQ